MDEPQTEGPAILPAQSDTHRLRPRTPASAHPSGMWFCPMPRYARREGASPTGWVCLQSPVPHLRSVHLLTGAAPPKAWLDAQGLRLCLACREISPQGTRCPGTRCSTAVMAALALGNTAPPAQAHCPLAGALPAGLDLVHLPGTRIPTLRRIHVRPGNNLPAAGSGDGTYMGDIVPPSHLPPHRPRLTSTWCQGDEVFIVPAMPAQLPGGSHGPLVGTDCPHPPAGDDRRPPDTGPD